MYFHTIFTNQQLGNIIHQNLIVLLIYAIFLSYNKKKYWIFKGCLIIYFTIYLFYTFFTILISFSIIYQYVK